MEEYKNEEISISVTGHSLGAALAILTALDITAHGLNIPKDQPQKACPVTAFAFACPRVGNSDFQKDFSGYEDLRALRIRNKSDIVPDLPVGYSVVGEELVIDTEKSKHLKISGMFSSHHLMAYLHGIAGTLESKGGLNLEVNPDIALVNKRMEKNKGMVQQADWKIMDHNGGDIRSLRARL